MIFLSGAVDVGLAGLSDFGYMLTPNMGNNPDLQHTLWAADTGCFTQPDSFNLDKYLAWLKRRNLSTLLFATAPDRLGDWKATIDVSLPVLHELNALFERYELPAKSALVAQDGLMPEHTPWDSFGCLFLGGSIEWKLSWAAQTLVKEAKRLHKWVHMGRVNMAGRMKIAHKWGCDSVDGTYLAFGRDINRPKLFRRVKWVNAQRLLSY